MALVDDRARGEVVRGLLVVLALEREQPATDHAAVVGCSGSGLGLGDEESHPTGAISISASAARQTGRTPASVRPAGWSA